jgi:hypothetical protein
MVRKYIDSVIYEQRSQDSSCDVPPSKPKLIPAHVSHDIQRNRYLESAIIHRFFYALISYVYTCTELVNLPAKKYRHLFSSFFGWYTRNSSNFMIYKSAIISTKVYQVPWMQGILGLSSLAIARSAEKTVICSVEFLKANHRMHSSKKANVWWVMRWASIVHLWDWYLCTTQICSPLVASQNHRSGTSNICW